MQNLLDTLKELLSQDENLVIDGHLNKAKIEDLALKLDAGILHLLLQNENIKNHFFTDVDGTLIFDKLMFQQFINNKSFLPDSYTVYKNKIGLTTNGQYLSEGKEVVLTWPYKDCVLEGGQTKEDQKRDEIFWNQILAPEEIDRLLEPKVLTGFRSFDIEGEHGITDIKDSDNLILKGNNLIALHSLKKRIAGKLKFIYLDPPYNTDRDSFQYNDTFSTSTWLTFMKNRLEVGFELLDESGIICVQISDKHVSRLRLLMDDVFGEDNFINKITVKTRSPSGFKTVNLGVFETAEYLLMYGKDKKQWRYNTQYVEGTYDENYKYIITNLDEEPQKWEYESIDNFVAEQLGFDDIQEARSTFGRASIEDKRAEFALLNAERVFRFTTINTDAGQDTLEAKAKSLLSSNLVVVVPRENYSDRYVLNGGEIAFYSKKVREIDGRLVPTILLSNIWTDISWEGIASEGKVKLKQGKKPEKLLRRLIDMTTSEGDIVMDFFLGSGTTASVAHKMKRQYIGVEQLDYGDNDSVIRLKTVIDGDTTGISKFVGWQGGGSFIYCELMSLNEQFVQNIQSAKDRSALQTIWTDMQEKGFLSYKILPDSINLEAKDFQDLTFEEQQRFMMEIIDKNMLYVNYSDMNDEDYAVSDEDKRLTQQFYELGK